VGQRLLNFLVARFRRCQLTIPPGLSRRSSFPGGVLCRGLLLGGDRLCRSCCLLGSRLLRRRRRRSCRRLRERKRRGKHGNQKQQTGAFHLLLDTKMGGSLLPPIIVRV